MQLLDARGNQDSGRVHPWSVSNPIAGVDGRLSGRRRQAEIRAPDAIAPTDRSRQLSAMSICARQTTKVGAESAPHARDEEAHRGRNLRIRLLRGVGLGRRQEAADCETDKDHACPKTQKHPGAPKSRVAHRCSSARLAAVIGKRTTNVVP